MERNKKIEMLADVERIFRRNEVPIFLKSGLLLGLIRDNDFIEWDDDFDFGSREEYLGRIRQLAGDFVNAGYSTYYSEYNNVLGLWKDGWSIDIDFWRVESDRGIMPLRYVENAFGKIVYFADWCLLTSSVSTTPMDRTNGVKFSWLRNRLCRITDFLPVGVKFAMARSLRMLARKTGNRRGFVVCPREFLDETEMRHFHGVPFLAPRDYERYLEHVYGKSWRTPIRDFDFKDSSDGIEKQSEQYSGDWAYRKQG